MASVDVTIAGRRHELACRDGEETRLLRLVALVDAKALDAARAMGGMSEARQMLFAALMLADDLDDARVALDEARESAAAAAPPPPDPAIAATVALLAERVERLAMLADAAGDDAGVETSPDNA